MIKDSSVSSLPKLISPLLKFGPWIGALDIAAGCGLAVVVSLLPYRYVSPLPGADLSWAIAFFCAFSLVSISFWVWRGRALILVAGASGAVFFLVAASLSGAWIAVLGLAWLLWICISIGNLTLARAVPTLIEDPMVGILLAAGVGFGEVSFLVMGLGLAGRLYPWAAYTLLGVLSLISIPWFIRYLLPRFHPLLTVSKKTWATADLRLQSLMLACLVLCGLGGLAWAMAPATQWDTLVYHLGVPQLYIQAHAIVKVPEEFRSYWVHNGEMLYTLALLIAGQPLPGLIDFLYGVMTAMALFSLGKRLINSRVGWLAALAFFSLPLITFSSGSGYIDLIVTFYCLAALYSVVMWIQQARPDWLILAGILTGLAISVKLTSVLVVFPLTILVLWRLLASRLPGRRFAVLLGCFAIPAVLLAAPWLIRDGLWSGNPIFPWLNAVFQSKEWPVVNTLLDFKKFGHGQSLVDFFRLPADMTIHSRLFSEGNNGIFGAVLVTGFPWFVIISPDWFKNRATKQVILWLVFIMVTGAAIWFKIAQYYRYFILLLPILALFTALNIEAILHAVAHFRFQRVWLIGGIGLLLVYLTSTRIVMTKWNSQIPEHYPLSYLSGQQTRSEFLAQAVSEYSTLQFLEGYGQGEKKVLSLGVPFHLYTTADIHDIFADGFLVGWMDRMKGDDRLLAAALVREGYQYILYDPALTDYQNFPVVSQHFLKTYTNLLCSARGVMLYQLKSSS